jgi:uncharacterized protein YodC (DUF2158 family)
VSFDFGDVVKKKGGSQEMTVHTFSDRRYANGDIVTMVVCRWFDGPDLNEETISAKKLERMQREPSMEEPKGIVQLNSGGPEMIVQRRDLVTFPHGGQVPKIT